MLAFMLVTALVTGWPATAAYAVTTVPVVGNGDGRYADAAPVELTGAFDRFIGELDASPAQPTPQQVKDLTFRRRILELRLLMDLNALAYDPIRMKGYREAVDAAYEASGAFQDIAVAAKILSMDISGDVVNDIGGQMLGALAPFRDPRTRAEMRDFLAHPLHEARTGKGLHTPGLWDLGGESASNDYDALGNVALLTIGIMNHLQGADLGVSDIFDPNQKDYFHTVRRQTRAVLLYAAMFPSINDVTQDVATPLNDLVDQYGEVGDDYVAYQYAQALGGDVASQAGKVQSEFDKAQTVKDQLIATHAYDAMVDRLNQVRDAHRLH